MARTFAYLFGSGATLVLATLPLVDAPDRFLPGLVGSALAAYCVVATLLIGFDRLPRRLFVALPGAGALMVSVVVYSGGNQMLEAYSMLEPDLGTTFRVELPLRAPLVAAAPGTGGERASRLIARGGLASRPPAFERRRAAR